METQTIVETPSIQMESKSCKQQPICLGGSIFKTNLVCGCCFCETGSCLCEWHKETNGFWS
ncbi:MAG: hypothetical protein IPI45_00630 [Saprospiraceae bacterium]|nr:hypothetical protein [Saprospiraceae bacterium]MBK7912373.1 hypothetical protein [Saprospiraceae bacterium]